MLPSGHVKRMSTSKPPVRNCLILTVIAGSFRETYAKEIRQTPSGKSAKSILQTASGKSELAAVASRFPLPWPQYVLGAAGQRGTSRAQGADEGVPIREVEPGEDP